MTDEQMSADQLVGERTYPAPANTRGMVSLLVAAAVIALIVNALSRDVAVVGPYANLQPTDIVWLLASTTTFLTAAAIVFGAGRWRTGRRLLLWGAALLALHGLLDLGIVAWIAWGQRVPELFTDTPQLILAARAVTSSLLSVAGWLLLAAGLWTGLPGRATAARGRPETIANSILVVGITLTAIGIATITRLTGQGSAAVVIGFNVGYALSVVSWTGMALLAAAAFRRLPEHDRVPELLIGVGASVAMIVAAYLQLMPFLVGTVPFDMVGWLFILPNAIGVVGWGAMIAGFALARIAPRRELVSRQPTPRPA